MSFIKHFILNEIKKEIKAFIKIVLNKFNLNIFLYIIMKFQKKNCYNSNSSIFIFYKLLIYFFKDLIIYFFKVFYFI
jgi:hypothetical protein